MCTPEAIVEKLGWSAFNAAVKEVVNAVQYVRHYKENLEVLQTEMTSLKSRMDSIGREVGVAKDRGEEIEEDVSSWQMEADKLKVEVDQLKLECTPDKENVHCFKGSCPNFKQRYQFSEQANKLKERVNKHTGAGHFNRIAHPKPPPAELELPFNKNYLILDSRTSIFNEIVNALKDPKIKLIGVHGPGGVGKTTLAEEVGRKLRDDGTFKQVPLARVSNKLNVHDIQLTLADKLNVEFDVGRGEMARATKLWHKFTNGEKYLVILDDIWQEVNFDAIGIPLTIGTCCKVLITSRNKDLLQNIMQVHRNFSIPILPDSDAWILFKKKVGNSLESQPKIHSLAKEVCNKCIGLPVAINALGAALEGKEEEAWKTALVKLGRYMLTNIEGIDSSVWATLRLSYEMLQSSDAKSCFLLCCLFDENAEIRLDDLMRHCVARSLLRQNPRTFDEAANAVNTVINTLKSSSLLLNSSSNENVVRIHDVIRDVGIEIGRNEEAFFVDHGAPQWPKNYTSYSTISLRSGKIKKLPEGLTCSQLHTLILDNEELSDLDVPDKFFIGMENLTVLILTRLRMQRLPSSLANLTKLRMLYLNECQLEDIAILGDLKENLEVLSLRGSEIKALPKERGQVTGLRLLDLRDCHKLEVIPQGVIANLTSLEELYFPDEFDNWEALTDKQQDTSNSSNVSLDELRRSLSSGQLTTLHIFVPNAMLLPKEGLKFENLKEFKISVGSRFYFYEKRYSATRMLKLVQVPIPKELIPLVDKAEVLYLDKVEGLKKVLHDRHGENGLCNWKNLTIISCVDDSQCLIGKQKSLVPCHGLHRSRSLGDLTVLIIQECNFKYLFSESTARELILLERLSIGRCKIMEEIVRFEGQNDKDEHITKVKFSKLKQLELKDLPNLISFYAKKEKIGTTMGSFSTRAQPLFNEMVIFPVLEDLLIDQVGDKIEIWDRQSIAGLQEQGSFCQLMDVSVSNCERLTYVFLSNMHPLLKNLTRLRIAKCGSMEGIIVGFEGEQDEDGLENGVTFSKLSELRLRNLPNLISFCTKLGKTGTTERSSSTNKARSLFHEKVNFLALKGLVVDGLANILQIWDNQSPLVHENAESFSQLEKVEVNGCVKLMNLGPSYMLGRLRNLQELGVQNCPNIEYIVYENGKEEKQATDDSNLVLIPQLRTLRMKNTKNLKSFYSSSKRSNAQSLFDHQVAFPALETLYITNAPNITKIWNKKSLPEPQKETESFCKLKDITVESFEQLVYVFPSYMLPRLQNLHTFKIKHCKKVEVIVTWELKEKEAANNDVIMFPQLKNVALEGLDKLRSFYPGTQVIFFSNKVAFPALETLYITNAPNITEIWNKKSLPEPKKETESFCKLKDITVESCEQLVYVFPSYMLPRLQNLHTFKIKHCKKVKVIVTWELKEKEAANNDVIVFPQLKNVALEGLDKLRSFCPGTQVIFFSNKVAFPALETLNITNAPNITEIWNKKSLPEPKKETKSFCKLKDITVESCEQLVYVFPSYMLPRLQNLHTFKIKHCEKVEVIVTWELKEKEAAKNGVIVFPQLKNVALEGLDKLRSFCPGTQVIFFSNMVAFPALETLYITNAPNITEIWNKKSLPEPKKETESFCKLKDITVESCEQLVYVFPSYILPRLQNLHTFKIKHCEKVEVIVTWELKEKEAANNDVIVFPQLKNVALEGLDKLRSFCPGTQVIFFSNKVAFPTLEILFIGKVPNITEIWDRKSLPELEKKIESVCKLKDITVENCEQLVYVLPNYMLPQLKTLQILKIKHCKKVEAIVSWELKEEEVANNDVIVFPQLKNVEIEGLDKVRSFCPGTQVFFSNKLAFPTLETLKIGNVPNVTEIWDKQQLLVLEKETESFCKLKNLTVENCEQLLYVFPSYMLPQLQINLQTLEITDCKEMEVILSWELKEKEAANNGIIVFSKLVSMWLQGLDELTSFYSGSQVFFANKLAFPALETLYISNAPNITEIWDKQQLSELEKESESFCKLDITIANCKQLVYVFPSYMLSRLQDLHDLCIRDCKKLEVILSWEQKEKEAANNDVIVFSQLVSVSLVGLDKLISFCSGSQVLFSNKVAFPALEELHILDAPNIIEIWDKQQLPKANNETESFYKLGVISVEGCEQLVYVFPFYMLPQLQNLKTLEITDCEEMEVIVSRELKEKEAAKNDVIVFSQLEELTLTALNKCTSFCSGTQVFFSNKDAFPDLVKINLDENLESFRDETSTKKVVIEECGTSGKENDHSGEEG